jgi:hypothetical protein
MLACHLCVCFSTEVGRDSMHHSFHRNPLICHVPAVGTQRRVWQGCHHPWAPPRVLEEISQGHQQLVQPYKAPGALRLDGEDHDCVLWTKHGGWRESTILNMITNEARQVSCKPGAAPAFLSRACHWIGAPQRQAHLDYQL